MSQTKPIYAFVIGTLFAGAAFAQSNEATEYGPRPHPPRIDFQGLGISPEQAAQVKNILREGREYGSSRDAVRAQLSTVLNETQMGALHTALEARRANAGTTGAAAQPGHACPPKTGAATQGQRPAARSRVGS